MSGSIAMAMKSGVSLLRRGATKRPEDNALRALFTPAELGLPSHRGHLLPAAAQTYAPAQTTSARQYTRGKPRCSVGPYRPSTGWGTYVAVPLFNTSPPQAPRTHPKPSYITPPPRSTGACPACNRARRTPVRVSPPIVKHGARPQRFSRPKTMVTAQTCGHGRPLHTVASKHTMAL